MAGIPTSSAGLNGALARDVATLELELERANALLAVSMNGYWLQNVSERWRADRGVVLAAVRQCGEALRFASSELVLDSIIVLAAVLQNPSALKFAARQFEGAKHVVIAAVRQDPGVIEFADAAFKRDPEVLLYALSSCSSHTRVASGGVGALLDGGDRRPPHFLPSFDEQLLVRLSKAVEDWVQRHIASRDEAAADRLWQQKADNIGAPWRSFSCADYAGWSASELDSRAFRSLSRSKPFRLPKSLEAHVLEFLGFSDRDRSLHPRAKARRSMWHARADWQMFS